MENSNGIFNVQELESIRTCEKCGKPIKRRSIAGMVQDVMCSCVAEEKEKERQQAIERGRKMICKSMRELSGIKRRYSEASLQSFKPIQEQRKAFEEAQDFVKRFAIDTHTSGLIIIGTVGSGKTHISAGIANDIIDSYVIGENEALNAERGSTGRMYTPVQFISTVELIAELKSTFDGSEKSLNITTQKLIDKYKTANLLILDDLGAEKTSEWVNERLNEIIDYRYSEMLPTIITTNCIPRELIGTIGQRCHNRLKECCKLVTISCDSLRKAL